MARYATTEELIECKVCFIRCALRELISKDVRSRCWSLDPHSGREVETMEEMIHLSCPNCQELLIIDYTPAVDP